ncbi:hypothetical protein AVEN_62306-1 [Araneus ventricosus]|uniref:Uncharacterized protein n=1 Tax=Araneus ventricosus TaxID=182803 RepID=A0A4Y2W3Y1_ARAVE|nr:hypothetical protein AVEN_62306-1 [Araneus ventricosus]
MKEQDIQRANESLEGSFESSSEKRKNHLSQHAQRAHRAYKHGAVVKTKFILGDYSPNVINLKLVSSGQLFKGYGELGDETVLRS